MNFSQLGEQKSINVICSFYEKSVSVLNHNVDFVNLLMATLTLYNVLIDFFQVQCVKVPLWMCGLFLSCVDW